MLKKIIPNIRSPIILLLLASFLKEMVFSSLVPIWHTPDEQAHFAQVAYFAEQGRMPFQSFDLNREILISEILLGTERDERGNNKFTYHPEYNIEYTNSQLGKYEKEIRELPQTFRKEYAKYESANYPPFYYWLAAIPYRLLYDQSLIDRVYGSRFISIILYVGLIWLSYLIAIQIFPKNKILQISLPMIISFQPMLSFIGVGVSSDNLMNFLFTLFLYQMIILIKFDMDKKILLLSILTTILLYFTKPQFIIALPILISAIIFTYFLHNKVKRNIFIGIFFASVVFLGLFLLLATNREFYKLLEKAYPQSFFPGSPNHFADLSGFIKMSLSRLLHETIPWYFGVFKWLGVVLPIEAIRAINRVLIIAGFGICLKLFLMTRRRSIGGWIFVFLLIASLIYFLAVEVYDYIMYSTVNFSFGIQGRYFFPLIVAHFAIAIFGVMALIPGKFEMLKRGAIGILSIGMIMLNFTGLATIIKSYYDISGFSNFILQAGQYKPFYFKTPFLEIWIILYLTILYIFILNYILLLKRTGFNESEL